MIPEMAMEIAQTHLFLTVNAIMSSLGPWLGRIRLSFTFVWPRTRMSAKELFSKRRKGENEVLRVMLVSDSCGGRRISRKLFHSIRVISQTLYNC